MNEDELVEEVAGAWRPHPIGGELRYHPSWHDLGEAGRERAFELAGALRRAEAAMDPEGLSTTARRVLDLIRR